MVFRSLNRKNLSNRYTTWFRFSSNVLSIGGLGVITIALVVSMLGYLITPDSTPYANRQFLELATRQPGFSVTMLKVRKNENIEKHSFLHTMIHGQKSSYRLIPIENFEFEKELVIVEEYAEYTDKPFVKTFHVADVVYPVMIDEKILIMGDTLVFKDINNKLHEANLSSLQERITRGHVIEKKFPLGTDRFGRDLLSRLIIGTRISIAVGMISVTISLLIGIWLGAAAGYFGGRVDNTIMWLINVVWSIPTLLMVIAITLVLGKGFWQVFVAVGLTMWVEVARVVRGQVLSVKEKEYIEAARVLGFSHARIIFHHILPNVINPVIIISAANFATAILIESGLSFLGIGVQPPVPSWGNMIKDHYGYIIVDLAYLAILPGLAIMLMVLSFTLVGNGLRDALDVKGNK